MSKDKDFSNKCNWYAVNFHVILFTLRPESLVISSPATDCTDKTGIKYYSVHYDKESINYINFCSFSATMRLTFVVLNKFLGNDEYLQLFNI